MNKVYWLSRHQLSPAQRLAIADLHGDVEVVHDPVVFASAGSLAEYIRNHGDGFVYAVAGAPHYLAAAAANVAFGVFENHPARRADGAFGLAAVYHYRPARFEQDGWNTLEATQAELRQVWQNPDPASDQGEALIPVSRA